MLRKIAAALLCALFIAFFILAGFSAIYFILPSRKAQASIELAEFVSDPSTGELVETAEEKTEDMEDLTNEYKADVENVLHLRQTANTWDNKGALDLLPGTRMKILEDEVKGNEGNIFARVEVTSGEYRGQRGYVLKDYIVKNGEPTKRIKYEE